MSWCPRPKQGNACQSRRVVTTFFILGRRTGSCFQHWTIMSQIGSIKSCSCGRSGRSHFIIFERATGSVNPLNGHLPVKTLSRIEQSGQSLIIPQLTLGGLRTDLYHNHAKRIDICLLCVSVAFLDNLRGHKDKIQPTNDRGKAKICQTGSAIVVNENVGLVECC
jgi:hypothetical protein